MSATTGGNREDQAMNRNIPFAIMCLLAAVGLGRALAEEKTQTQLKQSLPASTVATTSSPAPAPASLKVFLLAGDEEMLRQGSVDGTTKETGKRNGATSAPADRPGSLL